MSGVLAMILAGGEGKRLLPLTAYRCKPSVPFAGSYRLIDFVLNNFVNSGFIKIYVLTQYKSQSLYMHLKNGWAISGIPGTFIDTIPAQMAINKEWYQGTADAIYQNWQFVEEQFPDNVAVFGSDHIYKMDIRQMVDFHKIKKANLTVSALRLPSKECALRFGVIEVDREGRMTGFEEKPEIPKEIPGDPGYSLVSMGNYVFETATLKQALALDHLCTNSSHDFGKDIIPKLYPNAKVMVYNMTQNKIMGDSNNVYWRDVGNIDAYWQAHMDLLGDKPLFSMSNPKWPLHTFYPPLPPSNFIDTLQFKTFISHSMISAGCLIRGANISRSILGFRSTASAGAQIDGCVLIGDNHIGSGAKIRNAILDRYVDVAPNFTLGYDENEDEKLLKTSDPNGPKRSDNGIIVIPRGYKLGF